MTYQMDVKLNKLKNDVRLSLDYGTIFDYVEVVERRSFPFVRCDYTDCSQVQAQVTYDLSETFNQT